MFLKYSGHNEKTGTIKAPEVFSIWDNCNVYSLFENDLMIKFIKLHTIQGDLNACFKLINRWWGHAALSGYGT